MTQLRIEWRLLRAGGYHIESKMFTPLDLCIQTASATNHILKEMLKGRRTWSSVTDSREDESSLSLMVSDNTQTAFCRVEILSHRVEGRGKKLFLEAIIRMDVREEPRLNLKDFAVERTMKEIWSYFPVITMGTEYGIKFSKESGPELSTKSVMNVAIVAVSEELSVRKLGGFDYDQLGRTIANGIAVMNAIHDVAKQIPSSEWN